MGWHKGRTAATTHPRSGEWSDKETVRRTITQLRPQPSAGTPQPIPTVDGEVDPRPVLEVGVGAGAVEEEHAALVPALVLSTQQVDAQRCALLDPHTTCRTRCSWRCVPPDPPPPPQSELLTLGNPAKPRPPPHSSSLRCCGVRRAQSSAPRHRVPLSHRWEPTPCFWGARPKPPPWMRRRRRSRSRASTAP